MASEITNIAGIGSTTAAVLSQHKFSTVASIANTTVEQLSAVPGFSDARAGKTIDAARQLLDSVKAGPANDADRFVGVTESKTGKKDKKARKAELKGKKKEKNKVKGKKNKKDRKKQNKKGKK